MSRFNVAFRIIVCDRRSANVRPSKKFFFLEIIIVNRNQWRQMESNARFLSIKSSRFKDHHNLSDPSAETPSITPSWSHQQSPQDQKKEEISKLQQQARAQKIRRFLQSQHGAHHPVAYRTSYNFNEKWEAASKNSTITNTSFVHITDQFRWANFVLFPFLIVQLWFVSVFRVFKYDSSGWMFDLGLILELLCICHKIAVLVGEVDFKGDLIHQLSILLSRQRIICIIGNFFSVFYYSAALGRSYIGNSDHLYLFLLDLVLIVYKYTVLEAIYSIVRIEAIGSRYKLFMNLFDLASNVFMMIHVFSVLLFLCTYYSPDQNWHTICPINTADNWISDYLQAFYFACTTMLTVGFGDIRPTNLLQVMCILMVQLVGIMNNAYVINEIGVNLSQIHERRNTLEKDIANAQKLIKFNHLGKEVRNHMLDYLVKNQVTNQDLSIADEDSLLDKLSDQFKAEIKESSQIRVVHKNIFLLSNFTHRFQYEISKRLVKAIYPPHAVLPSHAGKERLYIITKGAVDILTEKKYKNRNFAQKTIKSIEVSEEIDHSHINAIYGYSSLFSGKPSRVKAVAKNFSVCYYLEYQDILQCIMKSNEDFQRYFEIKHKVQLLDLSEKYEFPNITSNRQHYSPNIFFLIRKEKKNKNTMNRKYKHRSERRLAKIFEKFEEDTVANSGSINDSSDSFPSANAMMEESHRKPTILSNFSPLLLNNINSPFVSKPRGSQARDIASKQYQQLRKQKIQQKLNAELSLDAFCENYKQYKNYYPKANLTNIVEKCNHRKNFKPEVEVDTLSSIRLALLKSKRKRIIQNSSSQ